MKLFQTSTTSNSQKLLVTDDTPIFLNSFPILPQLDTYQTHAAYHSASLTLLARSVEQTSSLNFPTNLLPTSHSLHPFPTHPQSTPYVMLKSDRNLTGNDRFEGFCIDLLRTIAELLGFNYDLYLVPDNKFGAENTSSGEWSGLVKEIIEKVSLNPPPILLV